MNKKTDGLLTLLLGTVIVFTLASSAEAYNSYLNTFNNLYGTSSSKLNNCGTCHSNNYRRDMIVQLRSGLNITDALIAVEPLDSDGDGFTNIEEITALTFPGDPTDFPTVTCTDKDGDGYAMEGDVCGAIDCNDDDPNISPAAAELCDGIDNNCDGQIDEGCPTCTDKDGDGYAVEGGSCGAIDCNDNDPAINPGAVEVCDDGIDNNCNGQVDEGCLTCTDGDGDGYAVEGGACGAIDCNDNDSAINPGAVEVCDDGIDNNCNGQVDEGCSTCTDEDGDGYAVEGGACGAIDCNDDDPNISPAEAESCDGIDNNCDGQIDEGCSTCTDSDGDGYAVEGGSCGVIDCNDNDSAINPGVDEICCDAIDNNCDGQVDEGCYECHGDDDDEEDHHRDDDHKNNRGRYYRALDHQSKR